MRGESLAAGTEPAQTRWRKALISRGVGLGGSSTVVGGCGSDDDVIVEGVLVVCTAGSVGSLGASCSRWVIGVAAVVDWWFLGCVLAGQPAVVTGADTVGFSAVGGILEGLLTIVLVGLGAGFAVGRVFVPRLTALSSSSDEMSTTIWADIVGCRTLRRRVSLGFGI